MNLENIIAVAGMPGLYKVVGQTKSGLVIESLESKKRMPIYATNKVSALEDICIYTDAEEKPLSDVFMRFFKTLKGKEALDHQSGNEEIKAFFESNIPDYDKSRVYVSDMKKVVRWYNTLHEAGLVKVEEDKKEEKKGAATKAKTKKETTPKKSATQTKATTQKQQTAKKAPSMKKTGTKKV